MAAGKGGRVLNYLDVVGTMKDSEMTSSELKQRYHRGGSAKDDELTAKQLRARHAIPSNRPDFATSQGDVLAVDSNTVVVLVVVFIIGIAALFFLLK